MPDDISPEDRERLAKGKFKEWFNECYNEVFPETFDKRVTETHTAAGTKPQQQAPNLPQQQQQSPKKHRSLMEICMSDLLNIG